MQTDKTLISLSSSMKDDQSDGEVLGHSAHRGEIVKINEA